MIFTAFKAVDSVLRGPNGGFDSHTLPPAAFESVLTLPILFQLEQLFRLNPVQSIPSHRADFEELRTRRFVEWYARQRDASVDFFFVDESKRRSLQSEKYEHIEEARRILELKREAAQVELERKSGKLIL